MTFEICVLTPGETECVWSNQQEKRPRQCPFGEREMSWILPGDCPVLLRSQGKFSGNGLVYWTRKLLQNVPCLLPNYSSLFVTVICREK